MHKHRNVGKHSRTFINQGRLFLSSGYQQARR